MNFIFISPNFPSHCEYFCRALYKNGVNVFGIGDQDYHLLSGVLKNALADYYKVDNLEDYGQVQKACGYFIHRYGRIDFIDSLNEHWLASDARLRTDFNVPGVKSDRVMGMKRKSLMKEFYIKAGVPVARHILASDAGDMPAVKAFIAEVGYPVVAKPDIGVGASTTYKISGEDSLRSFFATKQPEEFIIEEFITGNIVTFDGITDHDRNVLYAASHYLPVSLMDIVNDDLDVYFHSQEITPEFYDIGCRTAKAFDTISRFFHFEFFKLSIDKPGLGKKGAIVALEVNMRPPGAYIPDMMNFAADIDIYQAWADMIAFNKTALAEVKPGYICGYAGRKYHNGYANSYDDIMQRYGDKIMVAKEVESVFARAMGKFVYIFRGKTVEEVQEVTDYILE